MKVIRNCLWMVLLFLHCSFLISFAQDEPAAEEIGSFGAIDWVGQKIIARGIGIPPEHAETKAQAKLLAERAAVVAARRNLLEVIKGMSVDSSTRIEKFLKQKNNAAIKRIEGELQFSAVDEIKHFGDGTAEATVSMPIDGSLRKILMELILPNPQKNLDGGNLSPSLEHRMNKLEERMSALENRFDHLRKTSLEQEAALLFFRNIIEACAEPAATAYALSPAGYDSAGKDLILLREKIREHEARFAMFSKKLEEMSDRLAALETGMHRFDLPGSGSSSRENPCTALVIDARHAGFAPCLEPKIFVKGVLVYPGGDTDRGTAICNGYARYYRQLDSAEKSRYAGARPCIIKAKGTYEGKRSLEIEQGDYEILKQFSEISPLSGRMAIVF